MKRLYWDFRWAIWDAKEWLTVKWVLKYLGSHDTMYVHPRNGSQAAAIVTAIRPGKVPDPDNHTHIEGR